MNVSLAYRIGVSNNGQLIDGIYPVVLNETGEIIAIFKHPDAPRNPGTLEGFKQELEAYAKASAFPAFDREQFGFGDYFSINGWEERIISDSDLNRMLETASKRHI
jgi:hypothetical protein